MRGGMLLEVRIESDHPPVAFVRGRLMNGPAQTFTRGRVDFDVWVAVMGLPDRITGKERIDRARANNEELWVDPLNPARVAQGWLQRVLDATLDEWARTNAS